MRVVFVGASLALLVTGAIVLLLAVPIAAGLGHNPRTDTLALSVVGLQVEVVVVWAILGVLYSRLSSLDGKVDDLVRAIDGLTLKFEVHLQRH